ncbi:MAG TPA: PD-(D/E)XK nuclease family protein, partial [Thermoanaerobaculia bacterium]|nr:PD-(D/E)XK nuclease family protein [Thermoanaerobaculia bacterium]
MVPPVTTAPYSAIARDVASRLAASHDPRDPLAPWPEEVIVASGGLSDSIAAALLTHFPTGIAGLQMHSLETLARRIVNAAGEFPRVATEAERRLAMRAVTRALDDPLVNTRGAAAMLERSYRDIRDDGITLAEFSRRAAKATLRNRDRIRLVLRAWEMYERLIARLGAIDPADLLLRASALARQASVSVIAGFYDMTGAQRGLVRALQDVDRVSAIYTPAPEPRSAVVVRQAKTREDEIAMTCAAIAGLLESEDSSIGIVARSLDPYDVHLALRFSREVGFAVTATVPQSLASHRFGRAVISLVRLREQNFPRGEVLEIVRSGLDLATRINADRADSDTRYESVAGGRSADLQQRKFRPASLAIPDYIDAVAELEALTERIDAAWLRKISGSFRIESEADRNAVEALHEIADIFSRAEAWKRPFDPASLIDAIETAELQPSEIRDLRPEIWLGDVMRLRGRSFDHLFAVRMQDDLFPQRRTEDPLLPDEDRDRLGIRRIGDGRAEEQLLFDLTRDAAAKTITMSYAASDGFGKPLRKSHYLRGFGVASGFSPTIGALKRAATRPLQLLVRSGTESVFDGYVRSQLVRARVDELLQSVSPTQLEDFGECPQKFLWKHVLKVRALDDPEMQMQLPARDKGNVDHKILERFYGEAGGVPDALDRIVDEEFDELEKRLPPFNPPIRRIEREATKRILHEFVTDDLADLAEQALAPAHFEYKFDPVTLDIHGTPLRVSGKIDRVDRGADRYRVVDYKSGKAMRHVKLGAKIDRGVRLQLALYAMAAVEVFATTAAHVSGVIKPIGGAAKLEKFAFDLADHETPLRDALALFVEAMRRGDFPAFPHEN